MQLNEQRLGKTELEHVLKAHFSALHSLIHFHFLQPVSPIHLILPVVSLS